MQTAKSGKCAACRMKYLLEITPESGGSQRFDKLTYRCESLFRFLRQCFKNCFGSTFGQGNMNARVRRRFFEMGSDHRPGVVALERLMTCQNLIGHYGK